MDPRVTEVLGCYHERIRMEKSARMEGRSLSRDARLLAVGPDTGQLLNLLARSLDRPLILEIGTSYGYSAIWLADAARASGGRLVTLELSAEKSTHAQEMSGRAGLAGHVEFLVGDAADLIATMPGGFDLVLVDHWNHLYLPALHAFGPKLAPGAIVVTDNIRRGDPATRDYVEAIRAWPGMTSLPLPIGSGIEISRLRA